MSLLLKLDGHKAAGLIEQQDDVGARSYMVGFFARCMLMASLLQPGMTMPGE